MNDIYIVAIAALLPLSAILLVLKTNPYDALIIRGIMGAIAALVYALFGAADVALTEALVGTMLSITLYAVAVRSSMEMRLGWVDSGETPPSVPLDAELRRLLKPYHLRLEPVVYPNLETLEAALEAKEIHTAIVLHGIVLPGSDSGDSEESPHYQIKTRIHRLYEILSPGLAQSTISLDYVDPQKDLPKTFQGQSAQSMIHPQPESQ